MDKRGHKSRERRCVASGGVTSPELMTRFVVSPDRVVVPDIMGKLPGRGVWVTSNEAALGIAIKNGGFARGFKGKVHIADDLMSQVKDGYLRQLSGLLRMAKKSGLVILGFDQVFGAAGSKALGWRIEARDGAEDGRGKIRARARAMCYEMELPLPGVIACFTSAQLGEFFGRGQIIHAAIPRGQLAKSLNVVTHKLSGFEPLIPSDWPDIEHEMRAERRYDSEQE
ncbi:MAG: DUF448 domain-containing protein [Litorimonas sp.]